MFQAQALSTPKAPSNMRGRTCQFPTSISEVIHAPPLPSQHANPAQQQTQQRRKQIREAQRAYRSRQQSHLESLKTRVAQLEDVVAQVGQVMGIFHDAVVKQDVLLPQSKLMQTVILLQEEVGEHLKRAEKATSPAVRGCEFQGKINRVLSEACQFTHGPANESPPELPLTSDFWRLFFNSTNSILPPIQTTTSSHDDNATYPPLTPANQTIPYTTTPFTQKLYHACAKSGHRYLTNPTVTDAHMWPEFGLMLEHLPRQEVISYFERVLSTSPCNPVLDDRFPFISLGNAGVRFSSGMHNLLPFQGTNGVRVIPSEEEWFDVKDVEKYLFEKGIQLVGCYDPASYTGESSLIVPGQVLMSNMIASLDEATLIDGEPRPCSLVVTTGLLTCLGLSHLCICMGCVAGFRRRDVESFIWQNVQWTLD